MLFSLPKPKHLSYLPNHLSFHQEGNLFCLIPTINIPFHLSYKGSPSLPQRICGRLEATEPGRLIVTSQLPSSLSKHNALLSAYSALGFPASHSTMQMLRHGLALLHAHPSHSISKTLTSAATMPQTAWGTLLIMKVGDTSGSPVSQPKTQVTTGFLWPPFYYVGQTIYHLTQMEPVVINKMMHPK